jgi:hypothetical protein
MLLISSFPCQSYDEFSLYVCCNDFFRRFPHPTGESVMSAEAIGARALAETRPEVF